LFDERLERLFYRAFYLRQRIILREHQMKLSQAQAGICGRVAAVTGSHHLLSRLVSIGIVAGSRIEVLQNQPKQPVLFYCRDSVIALTKQDCDGIEIE